jgi:hypothetical protein
VPLSRPHPTASGVVSSAPIVLMNLETDQGLTGHAYVFCYTPIALKPIAELIEALQPSARCAGRTGWPTSSRSFSVTILVRDVTTRGLGLLENVVGSEGGHHVGMCGNEDPKRGPWDLQSGIYEGDGFRPRHLLPDDRTGVSVPPVLRFSFRRKRHPLLQSPYPVQTLHNLRDPRCPSRNLLLPLNVRIFCRLSSQADFCRMACKCAFSEVNTAARLDCLCRAIPQRKCVTRDISGGFADSKALSPPPGRKPVLRLRPAESP